MASKPIRIAVDAMGGDHAPREIVKGAVLGAREFGVGIHLVGQADLIRTELKKHDTTGLDIQVVPASEVIGMDESAAALRKKKDASIIVTAKAVQSGECQGMVAAGSTGAAMASALLYIGRMDGVDRPAIGVLLPSIKHRCLLIDAGANADCMPEMLVQFARMGSIYMQNVMNIKEPRVGLLNIGEEAGKGNTFVNSAFHLMEQEVQIKFIGNVEGRDLFMGGADVAVCDGFTGNVALKSAEGVLKMFGTILKMEFKRNPMAQLGYLLAKPAIDAAIKHVDPEESGGALLLGTNGLCIISHGGSKARGIKNAIRVAKEAVEADVLTRISHKMQENIAPRPDQKADSVTLQDVNPQSQESVE